MDPNIDDLLSAAEDKALEDRQQFDSFFKSLELVCARLHLRIVGDAAAGMLLSAPITRNTYFYEIFASGGWHTAQEITKSIYESIKSDDAVRPDTLALITDVRDAEFTINMRGRRLAKIYSRPDRHGTNPLDLMASVRRKGNFCDCLCEVMPEELLMINYCRILHNPARSGQWNDALRIVSQLWNLVDDILVKRVTGGSQTADIKIPRLPSDAILIGEGALLNLGIAKSQMKHPQIISAMNIDDIVAMVGKSIGRPVKAINHYISLPGDNMLTKHTIYAIISGGKQKPIIDVFNSTSYELVSVVDGGKSSSPVMIGGFWTIARFLLLDLWLLRLVKNSGRVSDERINDLMKGTILLLRALFDNSCRFNEEEYRGVNIADNVLRKKITQGRTMPPWLPSA